MWRVLVLLSLFFSDMIWIEFEVASSLALLCVQFLEVVCVGEVVMSAISSARVSFMSGCYLDG